MALVATTLSGAVAIDQNSIAVASATGFSAGNFVRIDDEIMEVAADYSSGTTVNVLRGREGTATQAHASGAAVIVGTGAEFASAHPAVSVSYPVAAKGRALISYSAAGAIAHPLAGNDAVAVLNGTTILAMTLAVPARDIDGSILYVAGNGKAAHTLTVASGLGNVGATADVITFAAGQSQGVALMACGGFWVQLSAVAGAATVAGPGIG